jgi:hypothetical protein
MYYLLFDKQFWVVPAQAFLFVDSLRVPDDGEFLGLNATSLVSSKPVHCVDCRMRPIFQPSSIFTSSISQPRGLTLVCDNTVAIEKGLLRVPTKTSSGALVGMVIYGEGNQPRSVDCSRALAAYICLLVVGRYFAQA